jgi:hypothetical protein
MSDHPKPNANSKPKILAHWVFTNPQWREFLYYEKLDFESRSLVDLKKVVIGGAVIISLLAILAGGKGGPAAFIFILLAGTLFIGFCYLIHRLIRKGAEQRLRTATGEVIITSKWVNINGVIFEWYHGWGVPQIYKDYIYLGEEKMPLLNFSCTRWMTVRGGREQIEKKCLVPVPPGRESEADHIISEITRNDFRK